MSFSINAVLLSFFKEHSPLLVKLAPLAYRVGQYARESLDDRSTGEAPASPEFLHRLSPVGNRTSASANEQHLAILFPPIIFYNISFTIIISLYSLFIICAFEDIFLYGRWISEWIH